VNPPARKASRWKLWRVSGGNQPREKNADALGKENALPAKENLPPREENLLLQRSFLLCERRILLLQRAILLMAKEKMLRQSKISLPWSV
jgi:hypothetical protein